MNETLDDLTIVHLSDTHVGSSFFLPNLLERAIDEINEMEPDAVVMTGDLTDEGFRQQYRSAQSYLFRIKCPQRLVVPGNHDSRNVGHIHFEELIGPRDSVIHLPGITIVGVDSSEPDLDSGRIGRESYAWLEEAFRDENFKIFALHHHLLPVPGTGRERSTVTDAGDLLEVLITSGVNIVLTGHKHVPYVWRLENMYVANAGTVSSLRLRGYTKPCYNVLEFEGDEVRIHRKFPFGTGSVIAHFSLSTGAQYLREFEPPVQQAVGSRAGE